MHSNPFLLALDYNHSGFALTSLTTNTFNPTSKFYPVLPYNAVFYGAYLDKINSGIGLSFANNSAFKGSSGTSIKLMYNYQIKLPRNAVLSFGGSFGSVQSKFTYVNSSFFNDTVIRGQTWEGDAGITLKTDRFKLGLGKQNLGRLDQLSRSFFMEKAWNVFSEYRFGSKEGIQFTPKIMGISSAFRDVIFIQGQLGFKNTYFIGLGAYLSEFNNKAVNLNIESILMEKIKLSCLINSFINETDYSSSYNGPKYDFRFNVEVGVGVQLGDRNTKKPEID